MKRSILSALMIFSVVMQTSPVFALNVKDAMLAKYSVKGDICPVVKSTIQEGVGTKETVRTAIQMGHKACYVIKCSFEGGGDLEQTVSGAIEAGATPDVISRCALEAGARPEDIARTLGLETLPGLPYTPASSPLSSITTNFPGGERGPGFFISPYRFK